MEDLVYDVWLAENCGAGSSVGITLLRVFGSAKEIYRQKPTKVEKWDFLSETERENIAKMLQNRSLKAAEQILESCQKKGIEICAFTDDLYPQKLHTLSNAPILLYYKGYFPMFDKRFTTAVVGTRTMSEYGRNMAYSLGYGLSIGGALVVSGMALGVDSMAMMGALDAHGTTVAVLGSGVDVVYPKEHIRVYERILMTGGCILSEFHPGSRPEGRHFPIRNRIISGLSDCGVVVEGNSTSGSLITARHLVYQGKKVFAVPGQVGQPGAEGPNDLIRNGALPVVTAEDILCEFEYMYPQSVYPHATHRAVHTLNVEKRAQETMLKNEVHAREGNNFVGKGTYGGRGNTTSEPPTPMEMPPRERGDQASQAPMKKPDADKNSSEKTTRRRKPFDLLGVHWGDHKMTSTADGENVVEPSKEKPDAAQMKKSSDAETEKIQSVRKSGENLLDEKEMQVYNRMKPNVPMTPDELVAMGDFSIGEVLAAMTVLEMVGAIEAGSGGYFLRTDPDDMPVTLVEESELEEHAGKA